MYYMHTPFFQPYYMHMPYQPWHYYGEYHPHFHGTHTHHGHYGHHGHYHHHGHHHIRDEHGSRLKDYGQQPFVVDIEEATKRNNTFRTALWTGDYLQVTLMSIPSGEDIGLEIHSDVDQFLRIEDGEGIVQMGDRRDQLNFERRVEEDDVILVPAGKWHNLTNIGREPLKLYSIYAPPEHPFGTVHRTKQEAMEAEH